jgi:hypothetical protein
MTLLTSGDRAVLRRIQDHADHLNPGLPYFPSATAKSAHP